MAIQKVPSIATDMETGISYDVTDPAQPVEVKATRIAEGEYSYTPVAKPKAPPPIATDLETGKSYDVSVPAHPRELTVEEVAIGAIILAPKPLVETTTIKGEMVKPTAEEQRAHYELTGVLSPTTRFVPGIEGKKYLFPKGAEAPVVQSYKWWQELVPAYEEQKTRIAEFEAMLKDMPTELQEAYKKGGVEAYVKAVGVYRERVEEEQREFEKETTLLPDGVYISSDDLADLKKSSPYLHDVATTQGYAQYEKELAIVTKATAPLNIETYVGLARKHGVLPKDATITTVLPDNTAKYSTEPTKVMSKPKLAKEIGLTAADFIVPGVWARHWDRMPNWQKGLNIGLDLLILVPVAGWAARAGGKALLKAGTTTIAKTLAKDLPKELVAIGQRTLATRSKAIAKEIKVIDKAFARVEKAATAVIKAERGKSTERFVSALKTEQVAKQQLASAMRLWGNKAMDLAYDVSKVRLSPAVNNTISKVRTITANSERFADYVAGTAREIARQRIPRSVLERGTRLVKDAARGYIETPRTIAEVTKALAMGPKKGAAYLRGQKLAGLPKAKGVFTSEKELQAHLTVLKKAVKGQQKAVERRVAKYIGKDRTLDLWDKYIQEAWPPSGGKWWPKRPPGGPEPSGGGVAVAEVRGVTAEQSYRLANMRDTGVGLQVAVPIGIGGKFGTIIANPREAPAIGVPLVEKPEMPDIVIVEPHLTAVTTEPKVEPEVKPHTWPIHPPIKPYTIPKIIPFIWPTPEAVPYHKGVYFIEPMRKGMVKTGAELLAEVKSAIKGIRASQAKTAVKEMLAVKPTTTTAIVTGVRLGVTPKTQPVVITKISAVRALKVAPKLALKLPLAVKPVAKPAVRPPPLLLPLIPRPPLPEREMPSLEELREAGGAVAFRIGLWWVVIKYPYASKADVYRAKQPPVGAKVVRGTGSAYKTIQLLTGKAPDKLFLDMGIMDVIITRPSRRAGKKGAIKFRRDPRRRTTGDISLAGVRAR